MAATLRERLADHQSALLAKIAAAATAADTATILSLNEDLGRTASLLSRVDDIGLEVETVLGLGMQGKNRITAAAPQIDTANVPGRGHGVKIRRDFLERAARAGLALRPYHGAVFQTAKGRRIGIAVATERKPDRWFLGLGEDLFDAAVLLCARNSGKVIDVCLPPAFFTQHGRYLSRSGDQIKFNVARREGHTILKVPSRTPERVDGFIAAIAGLDR